MPRNRAPEATARAREARKNPSVAEKIMREALRGSRLGFKFRREHPIGDYRLDFFCREAMLDVEMDGEQHDPLKDAERDLALAELGILTYRIPNRAFFMLDQGLINDYLDEIRRLCEERSGRSTLKL